MILSIDVESLLPTNELMKLDPSVVRGLAVVLANLARAKWIQLADDKLHRTSQDYVRGIQPVQLDDGAASVSLVGALPNMIEQGFAPYDMRTTLLGPNVPVVEHGRGKRLSKDGHFYRTIFFRLMGPGASGRNGARVTDVYAQFVGAAAATAIGRAAWRAMRPLAPGGRLREGEVTRQRGRSHAFGPNGEFIKHGGPDHATDLFAGATKMSNASNKSTFYGTFRTISTKRREGWIHPGYQPGANLAEQANNHAIAQLPPLIQRAQSAMSP